MYFDHKYTDIRSILEMEKQAKAIYASDNEGKQMDNERLLTILNALSESGEPLVGDKCAQLLKMSTSTFKKSIASFNEAIGSHGAQIVSKSGRGNGYQLLITDQKEFEHYRNVELVSRAIENDLDFNDQASRVYHITSKLLAATDWLKSQDLADSMGVSLSQFSRDMKLVRALLKHYKIKIVGKPHYGVKIYGEEFDVRTCFAYVATKIHNIQDIAKMESRKNSQVELQRIQKIIMEECEKFEYILSRLTLDNLVVHLYVAYHRVLNHQDIILCEEIRNELRQDGTLPLATAIVAKMQSEFTIEFPEDEVFYIIMHLSSKRIIESDSSTVTADVMTLVNNMLSKIKAQFNIDLSKDLNLRMMLATHTVPLLKRIKYHTTLSNPLLPEIRNRLLVAYDLALCCASVINEQYESDLSEDEIGYFALHIEVALNQKGKMRRKNILLVCATGRGSAQLLRNNFIDYCGAEVGEVRCCDVIEVHTIDLSGFDAIFTTVPMELNDRVGHIPPVFQMDSIINNGDSKMVRKFMSSSVDIEKVSSYFRADMFYADVDAKDRNELIGKICTRINQVYPLPADFAKAVLEREDMAQTNFGGCTAFPHPDRIMTADTFVSVCVLKTPLLWGKSEVKVVLLSSFAKGFIRNNEAIFRVISAFISDRHYADMLVEKPLYETLLDIIEMIY